MLSRYRNFIYAFVILIVAAAAVFRISDLDFWWHLKTGEIILQQKAFQYTEIYSFTAAGREYIDHEWLFQVISYLAYLAGGPAGVIFLKTAVLILIYILTTRHLLQKGSSALFAAMVVMISICAGVQRFIERPEVFSALYLVLILIVLDTYLETGKQSILAFVPALILLWANTHAAVILGIIIQAIFLAGLAIEHFLHIKQHKTQYNAGPRQFATLSLLLLITGLTAGINPYGFRIFQVPFELTAIIDSGLLNNQEWQRTTFQHLPLFCTALILTVGAHAVNFRRISWIHFLLTVFFAYIALKYVRNTGMFAILIPLLIAPYTARLSENRAAIRIGAATMLAVTVWVLTASFPFERGLGISSGFPERMAKFTVEKNLQGHMLNSYGIGGYLIWKLFPERKIFIDGRNEVYLPLLKTIVASRTDSRLWKKLLDDYGIEYALLNYVDELEKVTMVDQNKQQKIVYMPFSSTHFPRTRWALIYFDDTGMVFVRRSGINKELESFEYTAIYPEGTGYQQNLARQGKVDIPKAVQQLQRKLKEDPACNRARRLLQELPQS